MALGIVVAVAALAAVVMSLVYSFTSVGNGYKGMFSPEGGDKPLLAYARFCNAIKKYLFGQADSYVPDSNATSSFLLGVLCCILGVVWLIMAAIKKKFVHMLYFLSSIAVGFVVSFGYFLGVRHEGYHWDYLNIEPQAEWAKPIAEKSPFALVIYIVAYVLFVAYLAFFVLNLISLIKVKKQPKEEKKEEPKAVEEKPAEEPKAEEKPAEEDKKEEPKAEEKPAPVVAEEPKAEEKKEEEKPAEEAKPEEKPAEEKPAEEPKAEEKPAEEKKEEKAPAKKAPAKKPAAKKEPTKKAEKKPEEKKEEKPAPEKKAEPKAEKKAPAKKPAEKKEPAKKAEPKKEAPKAEPKKEEKPAAAKAEKPTPRKDAPRSYHISQHPQGGWQVKGAGSDKALKRFPTQAEAIKYARELEKSSGVSFRVHSMKGKIRKA